MARIPVSCPGLDTKKEGRPGLDAQAWKHRRNPWYISLDTVQAPCPGLDKYLNLVRSAWTALSRPGQGSFTNNNR